MDESFAISILGVSSGEWVDDIGLNVLRDAQNSNQNISWCPGAGLFESK